MEWFIINVLKLQARSCLFLSYGHKSTGCYLGAGKGGLRFSSFLRGNCCQHTVLAQEVAAAPVGAGGLSILWA